MFKTPCILFILLLYAFPLFAQPEQKSKHVSEITTFNELAIQLENTVTKDLPASKELLKQLSETRLAKTDSLYSAHLHALKASIYVEDKKYERAIEEYLKSVEIYKQLSQIGHLSTTYEKLARLFEKGNRLDEALNYYQKYNVLSDSINNLRFAMRTLELEKQYNSNLKEKEILLLTKQAERKDVQQKGMLIALVALLLLIILITYYLIDKKKEAKKMFEINNEIERQQKVIQKKNDLILESMEYAQHIQQSLISNEDKLLQLFNNAFLIYKPKDVVSGDFVFAHPIHQNEVLFCIIDCTGHGISGSFISLFAHQILTEFVNKTQSFSPAEVIQTLHETFSQTLTSDATEVKDSLELIVVVYDKQSRTLSYSGTGNVMYLLNQNGLTEFKFSYFPLGDPKASVNRLETKSIVIEEGDQLFFFTDGYADQKGGTSMKKFYYGPLRDMLTKLSTSTLQEQKEMLESTIENHIGQNEQMDDITVVGLRI